MAAGAQPDVLKRARAPGFLRVPRERAPAGRGRPFGLAPARTPPPPPPLGGRPRSAGLAWSLKAIGLPRWNWPSTQSIGVQASAPATAPEMAPASPPLPAPGV